MNLNSHRIFSTNKKATLFYMKKATEVDRLSAETSKMSDSEIKERFRSIDITQKTRKGSRITPQVILAFSLAREMCKRKIGTTPFLVQVAGGLALFDGKIVEMKTGEGKTLAAVMPVATMALLKKPIHISTANDYLAKRDAEWMRPAYNALGVSVGTITTVPNEQSKKNAYRCDVVYGTGKEFGFDFLRDNMVFNAEQRNMRGFFYGLVDEADSVLIDEAKTPLIISRTEIDSEGWANRMANAISSIPDSMFDVDKKMKTVMPSDEALSKIEQALSIDLAGDHVWKIMHYLKNALLARFLYERDRDYIVDGQRVVLIDVFTGRKFPNRKMMDGLHQALEAKEGVLVSGRDMILATISNQNFFRKYEILAGMTGTAITSAKEFFSVYRVRSVEIPTNKPMIRLDLPDIVYRTKQEKWARVVSEIEEKHRVGRPVLVGTISISDSDLMSSMLNKNGIEHSVLTARNDEKEAAIVKSAGIAGSVTISTNMAGRGTDIILGEGVAEMGGLHVIGTERHDSARIDNQLRGRSGRQGDPGSSQFIISLEDHLFSVFGSKKKMSILGNWPDNKPIEGKMIQSAVDRAQSMVEGYNLDSRSRLVDFDDLIMSHTNHFYSIRRCVVDDVFPENIDDIVDDDDTPSVVNVLMSASKKIGKDILLSRLDEMWSDYLSEMRGLQEGIYLVSYGRRTNPLGVYRTEGDRIYKTFLKNIISMDSK